MDITGILREKGESQQISDKFKKREFVITDNSSQYPQHIAFQLTQDKCELISPIAVGSEIKVHFNLRGREWISPAGETRYFNTLEVWRIEVIKNLQVDRGTKKEDLAHEEAAKAESMEDTNYNDDLPF